VTERAPHPRHRSLALSLCLLLSLFAAAATQARELLQLFVTAPYLELRPGPGRGYPVTQVIRRGESLEVLYSRTDWYKLRSERGVEGWAPVQALAQTRLADGSPFSPPRAGRDGFAVHDWELGVLAGDFGGATVIGVQGARSLTDQLAVEVAASQFLGTASNGHRLEAGLAHVFEPRWRLSPIATLGAGLLHVSPKATLVEQPDRNEQTAYVGAGARLHLARRLFVRGEYRHHTVFARRDANERIDEWRLGFAFFY
jgi:hypothetical protein